MNMINLVLAILIICVCLYNHDVCVNGQEGAGGLADMQPQIQTQIQTQTQTQTQTQSDQSSSAEAPAQTTETESPPPPPPQPQYNEQEAREAYTKLEARFKEEYFANKAVGESDEALIENHHKGIKKFYDFAHTLSPTTDKVVKHHYHIMYGRYLLPAIEHRMHKQLPPYKLLEIGLGCNMQYEAGASAHLYKAMFKDYVDLWMADYDRACVEKSKQLGKLEGINALTGDQANFTVLSEWIKTSGGNFDGIIDDGGHEFYQIWNSFLALWPQVKPGGYYFIEDLETDQHHLGTICANVCPKAPEKERTDGEMSFSQVIQHWINQLHRTPSRSRYPEMKFYAIPRNTDPYLTQFPIPDHLESITCISGACLFVKCTSDIFCSS
jgi:hypothetical protein